MMPAINLMKNESGEFVNCMNGILKNMGKSKSHQEFAFPIHTSRAY
jgi:hypothetical protein